MKPYVGVNYFSGWWREFPNKWLDSQKPGRDWRQDYVNRIPLNGCYDDQETMDQDILTASQFGIDYFQMLYYPVDSAATHCDEPHQKHLNGGIRHFLKSPYQDKMKFVVEYCNHEPFAITDDETWERTCRQFAQWFAHPSYFTVDSKALFKIHGLNFFLQQCNHDKDLMARRIGTLKALAQQIAGKDVLVCAGIIDDDIDESLKNHLDLLDFYAVYMDMPQLAPVDTDYDFAFLKNYALDMARKCAALGIPMMPYFPSGWNPRPWHDPRPSFQLPTGEQLRDGVTELCELIRSEPLLGIHSSGRCFDGFSIYAWNEYGEGGFLSPTLVHYDEKLRGLKAALDACKEDTK